jgi:hypothetical protein
VDDWKEMLADMLKAKQNINEEMRFCGTRTS